MSFNVGENVGPYRIVEQLGQGGMATVFKAYHASLDRYVAIKALHPAFNQDVNFESRFQREARVVAKLEHPNIVPVYDYAEHEGRPYLVMKFIEGVTLKARMDNGPLSLDEITKIADAVGAALLYAHKQGVLHRDIKPSNVLIATDEQIYLADFGLARMAQSGESTLSSDMIMGTPQYISPEQAMGKPDLDQRTDLYSFGVMLYEMVVGKVPYNADTPFSIIHDHIYSPLPLPRTVNPDVPEPVERVLLKALAKEPEDRFEDAGQLLKAFKEALVVTNVPAQDMAAPVMEQPSKTAVAQAAPTRVANVSPPPTVPAVEEKPKETVAVPRSEKKRSPWMWVSLALLVILCLGGLVVARNNRVFARLLQRQTEVPTQILAGQPPEGQPPPNEQPNRPQAAGDEHLNLALEAWGKRDLGRSMDEVQQLVAVQGNQGDFLIDAGTRLFDAEQYLGAAYVYARAAQNFKERNQPIPLDVREHLEESFYFSTAMDEFPLYIPLDALRENDPPLAFFAQSRYALLHGNMEVAHRNLEELMAMQPDWPLAQLLNAEIMYGDGQLLEPRRMLQDLIQSPRAPDWVKGQADMLLNEHQ